MGRCFISRAHSLTFPLSFLRLWRRISFGNSQPTFSFSSKYDFCGTVIEVSLLFKLVFMKMQAFPLLYFSIISCSAKFRRAQSSRVLWDSGGFFIIFGGLYILQSEFGHSCHWTFCGYVKFRFAEFPRYLHEWQFLCCTD